MLLHKQEINFNDFLLSGAVHSALEDPLLFQNCFREELRLLQKGRFWKKVHVGAETLSIPFISLRFHTKKKKL